MRRWAPRPTVRALAASAPSELFDEQHPHLIVELSGVRDGQLDTHGESRPREGFQRRMPEVNEAVVATYLAGGNTRRIRGALQPLLKAAPLSKSAVSRVVATLKDGLEAWRTRSLADLDVIYVYQDGFALRVRSAGKVVSVPVLGVVGVLPDGRKHLLALELCAGESFAAWKGCLGYAVRTGVELGISRPTMDTCYRLITGINRSLQ